MAGAASGAPLAYSPVVGLAVADMSGTVRLTSLCRPGATPTITDFKATLQRLRALRNEMRHVLEEQDIPQAHTVAPLQATMRESLQGLYWHPEFLHRVWHKFHTAMTRATVAGQCRRAACYVATLGYSMEALCLLWHDLCRVYAVMEQAKQEMVNHNLRLVISVVYKFRYTGLPLSDLIQDGNIGLMRGVNKFHYPTRSEVQHLCHLVDSTGYSPCRLFTIPYATSRILSRQCATCPSGS